MSDYSLGLLTIATNGYTKYLPDLISSASRHLSIFQKYCHYVFTDDEDFVHDLKKSFPQIEIKCIKVPSYGWPDATLLRYQIYNQHAAIFSHEILMHVDCDMYFLSSLRFEIPPTHWVSGMAFVEHPGFFRPSPTAFGPKAIRARVRSWSMGGYGDWETSSESSAFTPRKFRKRYVCGGAWFGFRKEFLEFCENAKRNVELDKQNNVLAKWHDESHLNYLISFQKYPTILSSRYCYESKFGKVLKSPILLARDKSISLEEQLRSMKVLSE